jgi:uracil-xanthine permease
LEFNAPRTGRHLRERPVVLPEERLSWPKTIGFGAQHVVAMFGATFLFPVSMGLDPQLAILTSGVSTILFLQIVRGRVPSYLGSSASFVGGATAIYAQGGMQPDVTGAILVAGVVLALVGLVVQFVGPRVVDAVLPPVVTGAVVLLIGLALAPLVGQKFWPQDAWVAFATMVFVTVLLVAGRGFFGRLAVLLGLVFGFVLSWVLDNMLGPINSIDPNTLVLRTRDRVDLSRVGDAKWLGLPVHTGGVTPDGTQIVGWHLPEFHWLFVLLVVPAVVALVAENVGHVKAVSEMIDRDLDPYIGRTLAADGLTTVLASAVGSAPTTTYAENIGVMAATRVYSVAAYYVAAVVAICLGLSPKFGAVIEATPGGVIGGITVVLYGMIGLVGVKIWMVNRVDFGEPVNFVPVAAGVVVAIGGMALKFSDTFSFTGIALGSLVTICLYHLCRYVSILVGTAPQEKKRRRVR